MTVRWRPIPWGIGALGWVAPGLGRPWWPLAAAAVLALGLSALGRWPMAGTAFCLLVTALVLVQAAGNLLRVVLCAVLMGFYLLCLDAAESGLDSNWREWVPEQWATVLVMPVAIVAVAGLLVVPVTGSVPVQILAIATATALLTVLGVEGR